jgi:plastocyanin
MAPNTVMRQTSVVLVAAAALAVATWSARASSVASASLPCGQWPVAQPRGTAPTPLAAPTPAGFRPTSAPRVVPVGAWSTCFRPAVVTIVAGETVQWQQADAGQYQIVLDTGTKLGTIRHVLEVRFNRPGTYRYHLDQSRDATGTIVVVGTARPGPAVEITEIPDTRG